MNIELTDEETDLVFRAIQDLPFKHAAPLVQKIQRQFEEAHKTNEPTQTDSSHVEKKEMKK